MAILPVPQLATRLLFGGAITLSLPADYLDASDLRQIPDNQEVFLSPSSETSLVIEILSMVEDGLAGSDLWESARFHFESIAHDNASLHSTILTPCPPSPIPSTPLSFSNPISLPTPRPIILSGTQRIHKFSHDPSGAPRPGHDTDLPDEVWIGVALWRCWLEDPSAGVSKKADLVCSVNVNLSAEGGNDEGRRVEEWWTRTVGTLRILDWELFGDTS